MAMADFSITDVRALEVLDSRARPTLTVTVRLADGPVGTAGVPSGASTGTREAVELRDGDPARYSGQGVRTAVGNVNGEIAETLRGRTWPNLQEVDGALRDQDGTPTKSRLGANALIGVSMAVARALAMRAGVPLYRWLGLDGVMPRLPVPHFNVVNGGVHAPNPLEMQEFMLAPIGSPSVAEAVRAGAEIYARLRRRLADGADRGDRRRRPYLRPGRGGGRDGSGVQRVPRRGRPLHRWGGVVVERRVDRALCGAG
jgi:enolase